MDRVKVKLVKSRFGRIPNHQKILKAIGLRKIGQEREFNATPDVLGMIKKVNYLLETELIKTKKRSKK